MNITPQNSRNRPIWTTGTNQAEPGLSSPVYATLGPANARRKREAEASHHFQTEALHSGGSVGLHPHEILTDSLPATTLETTALRHLDITVLREGAGTTMKRLILITAALSALVAASAAVAHLKTGDVSQVSATLSATTPANVQTRTYTCDGQTIEITTGHYSGTATSTTPT